MITRCRICGVEGAEYRRRSHLFLCKPCAESTPRKMSRPNFDKKYWGAGFRSVPLSIRKEFYDDYRKSSSTYIEYVESTTYQTY